MRSFDRQLLAAGARGAGGTSAADRGSRRRAPGAAATAPGTYQVFFGFDEAVLTAEGRDIVAQAAEAYRTSGSATVEVGGHTDTVGTEAYNLELSQRRADAVEAELVRLGVPAVGDRDQGLRRAEPSRADRRRGARGPQPPGRDPAPRAACTAPVVAEPVAPAEPAPMPEEEEPGRFTFTVGGLYGHNFGETDGVSGGDKTENDLAGVELTFDALPAFLGGLSSSRRPCRASTASTRGSIGRIGGEPQPDALEPGRVPPLPLRQLRRRLRRGRAGRAGGRPRDRLRHPPHRRTACAPRWPTTTSSATRAGTRASSGAASTSASASSPNNSRAGLYRRSFEAPPDDDAHGSPSSKAPASCKSRVPNPSVNQS